MNTKMKTMILLLAGLVSGGGICSAQDGFTVSGRLNGISANKVYLVAADFGKADTLAETAVSNGNFMFKGTVPGGARAVELVFPGMENRVPLLLENTMYQVQVASTGAAINGGGEAALLYKEFGKIGEAYAAEQSAVMSEYGSANAGRQAELQSRLDEAYKASVQKTLDLIKANADNYVSAYVVALGVRMDSEELLRQKYGLLGENARNSEPGKKVAEALDYYAALAIGKEAPNFKINGLQGEVVSLHEVAANIKLLVFWASWDLASRQANPQFIQLYQQFRPKNFEIISVSLDTNRSTWERAVESDGMVWINGADLKGFESPVAQMYMVGDALPYTVLVDGENKIVAKGLLGADLRNAIADLAKKNRKNSKE